MAVKPLVAGTEGEERPLIRQRISNDRGVREEGVDYREVAAVGGYRERHKQGAVRFGGVVNRRAIVYQVQIFVAEIVEVRICIRVGEEGG